MLASRSLIFVALTGLLAASCSSAVVPTYYGGAVIHPPSLTELVPPAPTSLLAEPIGGFSDEAPSYDVVPRQLDDSTLDLRPIAYDVAPRRLEPIPSPPSEPAPAPAPPPATKALLGPLSFISQTLNNCGPASIAEVLAFWGIDRGQADVQSVLRGDGNPYGMTPAGVPAYVASLGMDVVLGTGGTEDLIKQLLRAGFPVIVNQTVSDSDLLLHYRPVQGFDDERGVFIASDPLIGPQYALSYAEFDQDWAYTGHRFMVVYPADKVDSLNAALAAGKWDPAYAEGGGQAQSWSAPGSGPAPITTPVISGKPAAANWYSGPVSVGFRAADQSGFGVANTSYGIDKQPVQLYRGEFAIKDPGKHTVTFHSVNFGGSREIDKTVEIGIDLSPPVTTASVDGVRDASGAYKSPARLVMAAADDGSGVAKTTYSLDSGPMQTYSAPVLLPAGAHTVTYGSVGQAGQEVQHVLSVTVAAGASAGAQTGGPAGASAPGSAIAVAPPSGPPPGGYSICPLYDPNKAAKVGLPVAIRLQLCDSAGRNLSSAAVPLTLQSILGPPNGVRPALPSAFRFDPASNGYEAVEGAGPGPGTYILYFTAAGDPPVHMAQFRIG
ncbi:MAG TPA: C39 family peptidase [Chloroflexota bacterium]